MTDDPGPKADPDPIDWSDVERRLRAQPPRYDARDAWAKLERAIDASASPADVRPFPVRPDTGRDAPEYRGPLLRPRGRPVWATRVAAVLVLGTGVALAWRATHPAAEVTAPAALREVATAAGQRATVRLTDGTRVELGADSRLRYESGFGRGKREVYLEGEAYFDVVHDARRPFAVRTKRAIVRDIGTKFNVRGYADMPADEVVVAEGSVALAPAKGGSPRDTLLLRPGDLGRLDSEGRLVTRHNVDVDAHLAWMDGRLVFDDVPLRDVVPRLAHWYGVRIHLADSALVRRRYTATLQNETLPQLLHLMALSLALRIEQVGDTVVFYDNAGVRPRR